MTNNLAANAAAPFRGRGYAGAGVILAAYSLKGKKNGYSGDCSLADRMDRVYEKD